MNLLVRMPNWLGDVVMATPAIEALHHPGKYSLHLLIRPPWNELFSEDPRAAAVIPCNDRGLGIFKMASFLRAARFDAVVDFTHSPRSRFLWKLAGIKVVLRETPEIPADHQVMRYLSVIRRMTGELPSVPFPPTLVCPEFEKEAQPKSEILIFPAAAFGPAKMWSEERYRSLLRQILSRGWPVRLVGTERERPFLESLGSQSQIPVTAGIGLRTLMRLIAASSAVVSCDSGAAHLAAALGRPVVVLFFSTDPGRTAPIGFAVRPIAAAVPCRPCFLRSCPIGYLCRDAVTPAQVTAHLADIFDVPEVDNKLTNGNQKPQDRGGV